MFVDGCNVAEVVLFELILQIPANRDIEEVFGDTCRAIEKKISKESEEKRPVVFIIGKNSFFTY